MPQNRVSIFDTTLRDGEQSPGCSMNLTEKVRMAKKLQDLGVDDRRALRSRLLVEGKDLPGDQGAGSGDAIGERSHTSLLHRAVRGIYPPHL